MSDDDTPVETDDESAQDGSMTNSTGEAADPDEEQPESTPEDSDPFGLDAGIDRRPDSNDDPTTEHSPTDASEAGGADADAPLGSVAAAVDERRNRDADQPDDGFFEDETVPEIDTDVVWEQLDEGEDSIEPPDDASHDVRVIEKRSYCEQCPFFSDPPEVSCSHDGTEILELVDMNRFRVVDCPKVREDERLEQL